MSSTLEDALAQLSVSDPVTFASLPLPLARLIFLALPVVARGRASCVCRAWRDALADPSLWTRLDMSDVRVGQERFTVVLPGAARRARGGLRELDISQHDVTLRELLPVLNDNAGSLRELHLRSVCPRRQDNDWVRTPTVPEILAAAPLLQVLTVEDVSCDWEDAPRLLRAEPPLAPLQVRCYLEVSFGDYGDVGGMGRFGPFASALADAALQPVRQRLCIEFADTAQPAVMGALADAAVAWRLRELRLYCCTQPHAAPLARLLAEGSLVAFEFFPVEEAMDTPLLDAAGAALVADALRVNSTLTKLDLFCADLYLDLRAGDMLLGALTGHPSLREVRIAGNLTIADDLCAFGVALGALIAADAPALHALDCSENNLEDGGLAPIVEALALNRHLCTLNLSNNAMSEAFARERLLPAVRANTTLRELRCDFVVHEVQQLMRDRALQHG